MRWFTLRQSAQTKRRQKGAFEFVEFFYTNAKNTAAYTFTGYYPSVMFLKYQNTKRSY
ncbi:hypothetical protein O9929_15550 [Vibrio lentus]|nr:hypothetical protein [Vibrio lentus]